MGQPRVTGADEITPLKKDNPLRIIPHSPKIKFRNIRSHRKNKRTYIFQILLFIGIFFNLPYSAFALSQDPLLQKLDSHYYYPSQLGLKKLTAKIKWLQKDLKTSQQNFISHPSVLFSWNAESEERRFQVDPRLKELTEARREEIKNFFLNYREVILPRTLSETLSGFKSNRANKAYFKETFEYQSPFKNDDIQKYSLDINPEFWRISKIDLKRRTPPYNVTSDFKYIKKEDKWLVSETLARFDLGRDSYSEKTSYTYRKIMGFWLPVKIDQVFKKGLNIVHSYRFLISDYQIN